MTTAAFIHGARDVRVAPYVAAAPIAGETLVNVASVGLCGSDLHYYKDGGIGSAVIREPFVPGHEFSAVLTEDVASLDIAAGELVAVDPAIPCHQCEWCRQAHHNLCPRVRFLGAPPHNGAFTQQLAVPHASLVKLPADMTADQATMLEPLGVCIHALDLAKPQLFESVAVLGCGCIGLGVVQLLVAAGCKHLAAIDPQAHRRAQAAQFGAQQTAHSAAEVTELTDGRGFDLVIEATNSPDGLRDAIISTRIGGRAILIGIPDGDTYTAVSAAEARRRGLDLRFSRRMGDVYPRAIEAVVNRQVDVDAMISHRFDLADTPQAFELQATEAPGLLKSLIYPAGIGAPSR